MSPIKKKLFTHFMRQKNDVVFAYLFDLRTTRKKNKPAKAVWPRKNSV